MKTRLLWIALAVLVAACAALLAWTRVEVRGAAVLERSAGGAPRAAPGAAELEAASVVAPPPSPDEERPLERASIAPEPAATGRAAAPRSDAPGTPLSLLVLDAATGAPIEGATLVRARRERQLAVSDGQGRMQLELQPAPAHGWLVAATGYCTVAWSWGATDELAGRELVVLPLEPCAFVEGRVLDGAGQPVVAAALRAFREQRGASEDAYAAQARWSDARPPGVLRLREETPTVETDEDGAYVLQLAPSAAPWAVAAWRGDFLRRVERDLVLAAPGRRARVDFVLERGARVSGRVQRNGLDWSGELRWSRPDRKGERSVRVVDGAYALENLEPGPIRLVVWSEVSRAAVAEAELDLRPEESRTQDLSWIEAVQTIAGRVVDPVGDPLEKALVGARRGASQKQREFATRSLADGSFALEVPADETFVVTATDGVVHAEVPDVPAGASHVTLVLGAAGTLEVVMVDADSGEPIVPPFTRFLAWSKPEGGRLRRIRTRASPDGRARVTLPAGRILLEVDLTPMGWVLATVPDVLVTQEGSSVTVALERGSDVRFRLDREHARELRGHAVFLLDHDGLDAVRGPSQGERDPDFTRIEGMRLWAERGVAAHRRLEFDHGGRAGLRGLLPGLYELRCYPDDLRLEPSSILLGSGDVTIDLSRVRR